MDGEGMAPQEWLRRTLENAIKENDQWSQRKTFLQKAILGSTRQEQINPK